MNGSSAAALLYAKERFSVRLKLLQHGAGLSSRQLAMQSGISRSAICRWRDGDAAPSMDAIVRLCLALDCTPNDLLGWERR